MTAASKVEMMVVHLADTKAASSAERKEVVKVEL